MMKTRAPIRWTSLLLVLALLLALIPPVQQANANTGVAFTFDDFSTDMDSPTQWYTDTIEIRGTFNGVAADSITYKVERLVGGKVQETMLGTGIKPIIEGTNRFYFTNVKIFTGLNRVTVSGNSSVGVQSNSFYVYFPNVPYIDNIRLSDNRELPANKPVLVTTDEISLMFEAPNATSVTVQGKMAFGSGGDLFFVSGIKLNEGLNTLVFTASNSTMTYTVTRDVVRLYNFGSTAYDINIVNETADVKKIRLDSGLTIGSNVNIGETDEALSGKLTGKIALPRMTDDNGKLISPDMQVRIVDNTGADVGRSDTTTQATEYLSLTVTSSTYQYVVYSFETTGNFTISGSGQYSVIINGKHGTSDINYALPFNYKQSNSPYFTEVKQLYNVKETSSSGIYSYTSSSVFTNELTFFQTPIWLALNIANFNDDQHTVEISSEQGDVEYKSPEIDPNQPPILTYERATDTYYKSTNGELLFKITSLPAGKQKLKIIVKKGAIEEDKREFTITYTPQAFIHLDNIVDGQIFTESKQFTSITGKLINFNLNNFAEIENSLSVTINGTTKRYSADRSYFTELDQATGKFKFSINNDDNLKLVNGPNTIVISAIANGIPVTTHLTVYLFPQNVPGIKEIYPVPVPPTEDDGTLFENTGTLAYTTTLKEFEVVFTVVNTDRVVVYIDGQQHLELERVSGKFNGIPEKLNVLSDNGEVASFRLLYFDPDPTAENPTTLKLPDTGTKSVTITAVAGITTSSQTLQVTRIRMPYTLLSPKLPEERVINQNFLTVAIEAEGADRIVIGKEEMVKGTDGIFRLELRNLKAGNNTIKFTIYTGSEKNDGSFVVTYAAQNEVGAQYKSTVPSSGKVSVFNGALQLSFPKGTMLKQPQNNVTGVPTGQINLLNDQILLFGIADRTDGRTLKRYNRATLVNNGRGMADVTGSAFISNRLQSNSQFGFASQLFWVDAGYIVSDSTQYKIVHGLHPYADGDDVFTRSQNRSKWLVPTNRGTITLKYDPNIRNEAAKNLSVWHFDGYDWHNLGGVVNTSNKTVTASFNGFGYYVVMNLRYSFEDIIGHRYARNHMNTMFAKGYMNARSSSAFGAYENITRGEFATMIVKILDLPLNYDTSIQQLTFSDVPPTSGTATNALWDYRYIETAARAGIVSGLAPRQFAPGAYLTREQAATIIARALNYKLGTPEKDRASLAKQFTDAGDIDYYAVTSVQAVVKDKIMTGMEGNMFAPKAYLNRADMAIIAYNILTKLKKI